MSKRAPIIRTYNKINRALITAALWLGVVCGAFAGPSQLGASPAAPPAAPPLTWQSLQSALYPCDFTPSGTVALVDGTAQVVDPATGDELEIRLVKTRTYGDIDADQDDDTAVVMVTRTPDRSAFFDLVLVANDNGKPVPGAHARLGDRIGVRSIWVGRERAEVVIDTYAAGQPTGHPDVRRTLIYALQAGQLELIDQTDAPIPAGPALGFDPLPHRLVFPPETTVLTVERDVPENTFDTYVLQASEGQHMVARVKSEYDDVYLAVHSLSEEHLPLLSITEERFVWIGELRSTGDYELHCVPVAGGATAYTLTIELTGGAVGRVGPEKLGAAGALAMRSFPEPDKTIPSGSESSLKAGPTLYSSDGQPVNIRSGPGTEFNVIAQLKNEQALPITGKSTDGNWWQVRCLDGRAGWARRDVVRLEGVMEGVPAVASPPKPKPVPTPTPAPAGDKTIYLTFDDGPAYPWTQRMLDTLARYRVQATFFVIGSSLEANPDLADATLKAGHTLANHTWDHVDLTGIGHQEFVRQVQKTQEQLGSPGQKCLRPPYGGTDAFTRAYAEELGLRVVMWNVDPRDWSRPGVSAITEEILTHARPGAVILMHDGGGERSQTEAGLETVLSGLTMQGYTFEPVCK